MQHVRVGAGVRHAHHHQQVERVGLRVVNLDDPVAVLIEGTRVEQLVLRVVLAAPRVLLDKVTVRVLALRVVVAPPVPRMTGGRVEVPPVLLGVLSMVSLVAGQAEDPLLEDRVPAVPEGEPQAQASLHVGEARQPVLPPAVGARPGMVMGQVLPGGAARAVVLAHGAPLALAEVGAPEIPVPSLAQPVLQPSEGLDPFALRDHGAIAPILMAIPLVRDGQTATVEPSSATVAPSGASPSSAVFD